MSSFFVNANTDTSAISNMQRTQVSLRTTIERLSSGVQVPSVQQDTTGLVVAGKVTNIIGVSRTIDTTSRLQAADQALFSFQAKLARLRSLAGRATQSGGDARLNDEFQSVLGGMLELATALGLSKNGELARQVTLYIGGDAATTVDLSGAAVDAESLGLRSESGDRLDIGSDDGAKAALAALDAATERVADVRRSVSGAVRMVIAAVGGAGIASTTAHASASLTRDEIVGNTDSAVRAQANLNADAVFSLMRA